MNDRKSMYSKCAIFLVSFVFLVLYTKQPILGLTQEWFRDCPPLR